MHYKMSSAICFNLEKSKILPSGNGLKIQHTVMTRFLVPFSIIGWLVVLRFNTTLTA